MIVVFLVIWPNIVYACLLFSIASGSRSRLCGLFKKAAVKADLLNEIL